VTAFANRLKFTMASRKASLAADALQIYSIAKGVARDPGAAAVASLVSNLKRDLGRRGRAKGSAAAAAAKSAPQPGPRSLSRRGARPKPTCSLQGASCMRKIWHHVCGVIPPHILAKVAEQAEHEARDDARSTLEQMRELATERTRTFFEGAAPAAIAAAPQKKRRSIYDAHHSLRLPGKLVMSEHKPRSADVEVAEAYDGSGTTFDFYAQIFSRNSIDGRGMRVDYTVHYGTRFDNAMWNGHQMVYGDGDGLLFNRFTAALDVIGHELTHGVTQFTAALGYDGQTGALNEHISDAFGIMVKQFKLNQTAKESDWLLGAGLFTSRVHGKPCARWLRPVRRTTTRRSAATRSPRTCATTSTRKTTTAAFTSTPASRTTLSTSQPSRSEAGRGRCWGASGIAS
jgi:hypothetical protein